MNLEKVHSNQKDINQELNSLLCDLTTTINFIAGDESIKSPQGSDEVVSEPNGLVSKIIESQDYTNYVIKRIWDLKYRLNAYVFNNTITIPDQDSIHVSKNVSK